MKAALSAVLLVLVAWAPALAQDSPHDQNVNDAQVEATVTTLAVGIALSEIGSMLAAKGLAIAVTEVTVAGIAGGVATVIVGVAVIGVGVFTLAVVLPAVMGKNREPGDVGNPGGRASVIGRSQDVSLSVSDNGLGDPGPGMGGDHGLGDDGDPGAGSSGSTGGGDGGGCCGDGSSGGDE